MVPGLSLSVDSRPVGPAPHRSDTAGLGTATRRAGRAAGMGITGAANRGGVPRIRVVHEPGRP